MNRFGEILLKKRKEKNLTQRQLSKIARIRDVQICMYEKGKVIPTSRILGQITNALDLPDGYFEEYINSSKSPSWDSLFSEMQDLKKLEPIGLDREVLHRVITSIKSNYGKDLKDIAVC